MYEKTEILSDLRQVMEERERELQLIADDLSTSLQTSTKSSAGDKHETSRAMTQLEQEKLGKQQKTLHQSLAVLSSIDPSKKSNSVELGSLVETDKMTFFVSIGIGKLQLKDHKELFCISSMSPIAQQLLGKKKGDSVQINQLTYTILSVD